MSLALSLTLGVLASSVPCLERAPSLEGLAQGLERYVSQSGDVAYRKIALEQSSSFTSFLDEVTALCPTGYQKLTVDERIALLLNLYNAWVIDFMTGSDGTPKSILKVRIKGQSVFDAPVIKVRWHPTPLTLNQIEKKLLPGLRRDPRYHFALVCGARSCPKLRRKPYRGVNLDASLTLETRQFLGDLERNQLVGDTWKVSKLVDWYRTEFGGSQSATIDWIIKWAQFKGKRPKNLEFLEYDWTPNHRE